MEKLGDAGCQREVIDYSHDDAFFTAKESHLVAPNLGIRGVSKDRKIQCHRAERPGKKPAVRENGCGMDDLDGPRSDIGRAIGGLWRLWCPRPA